MALRVVSASAANDGCPPSAAEIATDRPDVTNSSLVVPTGSLQNENGLNLTSRDGAKILDGSNSRLRLGIAPCLKVLVDLPTYFVTVRSNGRSVRCPAFSIFRSPRASRCRPGRLSSPDPASNHIYRQIPRALFASGRANRLAHSPDRPLERRSLLWRLERVAAYSRFPKVVIEPLSAM